MKLYVLKYYVNCYLYFIVTISYLVISNIDYIIIIKKIYIHIIINVCIVCNMIY